jgi:hypothetical protein
MKVSIRDRNVFDRLKPTDVAGYLRARGWRDTDHKPEHSIIWKKKVGHETADLLLPLDRKYLDFALRMADAVKLIAAIEDRSELAVIDDIQTTGMDIVRIQLAMEDAADGSVLAERGAAIYDSVPELFAAGACAVNDTRLYFATKKSKPVTDFVGSLRFGQTEYGSYVVRVLSPVSPSLPNLFGPDEDPFERKAIHSLFNGLHALNQAAGSALLEGEADAFKNAVSKGVSANLCEAVVQIVGKNPKPHEALTVLLTPAKNRPLSAPLPEQLTIPGDRIPIIGEAGRVLKAHAPSEPEDVRGVVVKLQSMTDGGIATVATFIDGQPRKVAITLPDAEHKKAISAYDQRAEIICRGVLTRTGQLWSLHQPGPVLFAPSDD